MSTGTNDPTIEARPAPALGRKALPESMRAAAVQAAAMIMEKEGLAGVKARPVAKLAGVSVGSIYNMFGDLDELIRLVNGGTYDKLYTVVASTREASTAAGKSPHEVLLDLAQAYLGFVETHQTCWLSVLSFNRQRSEPPPQWYLEKELALLRVIEDTIAPLPGGQDPADRHTKARALWASVHGIVTLAVADGFMMQPLDEVWRQMKVIVDAVARALE